MHCLEHGAFDANVGAGRNAKPADETGAEIRNDVAIQILQQQSVVRFRLDH